MHLIYETEQEAIDRADECGKLHNYSHWKSGEGTRWTTAPAITADGKWALNVTCYQLSEEEELAVTEEVTFPEETI